MSCCWVSFTYYRIRTILLLLYRGDSSKLLFQLGYLKVLKELALSGQLQLYNIRGVCWKVREDGRREGV